MGNCKVKVRNGESAEGGEKEKKEENKYIIYFNARHEENSKS